MAMVVTCKSCRARFRLDVVLLQDAKGARIRCRKCGGYIIVRNPEAPGERRAVGADLSGRIRPVPAPPTPDEKGTPPAVNAAPAPPASAGRKVPLLEEALIPPSAADAGPNPFGDYTLKEIGKPRPTWNAPPRRRPRTRPLVLIASLSVLLLAGGALYFGAVKPGQYLLGKWFPAWGSTNRVSAAESPIFDIQNVKWYQNKLTTGGSLYVIQGTVANVGKGNSSGIRIQATLLGADNQAILKNEAFAGNLIEETLLPHMSRVRIEGFLGMRYGEGNVNRDIPPGKTLPFMVVFFNPPEQIGSFIVKAMEADEPGRILSADWGETDMQSFTQRTIRSN